LRFVLFCHSLVSDWNHGNAHFLRGIVSELLARGHDVDVYEPHDAWSVTNLLEEAGPAALAEFQRAYPRLTSRRYANGGPDLDAALDSADVVFVHEWNDHGLAQRIGRHKARGGEFVLLFHDTHHRSATDPRAMAAYDLEHYDGVLAFGEVIRQRYLDAGWSRRAWTWHEAADTRVFRPLEAPLTGDVIWVGNWGDEERSDEIRSYLLGPIRDLGLNGRVHGVRYPDAAIRALGEAGIEYGGWLANFHVPELFARFKVTVHIPRRPYVVALPGVPTIRVFEALACGIPLVSAWWDDCEGLFSPGRDFLVARSPEEMRRHLRDLVADPELAAALAAHGRRTIEDRHTCAHRVDELLSIVCEIAPQKIAAKRTDDAKVMTA
jgi:spore maturation protein CgeB